ncbi:MAG: peptide-N-glycosidase F-related protein [Flavobacteriales bacterium]|jgi:hypothetical protein
MKTNYLLLLLFAFSCNAFATDTTTVRIHDHTDMTWYGNYDEWGVLPSTDNNYRKVYLHYTMGCATGGCSDWDYTTQIFVRHRTGEVDSTLQESPNFTVNGTTEDSLLFSDSTFVHFWNTSTQSVDSTLSNTYEIAQYNDPTNPTVATDTLIKYESEFYNMVFDTVGSVIDSFYVASTDTLVLDYYNWHTVFDVIENYELARVITPYGNGLSNNWEFTTTFDVTDFASILSDSVEIRCHYSGWSSGFSASLDFEFIEGTPARDVVKVENIYSGGYNYNSSTDFEANQLTPQNFLIDPSTTSAMVKMSSTGHGFDNNQSAAEFKPINYYLKVDGVQTHTQYNWDNKCGENPIYPQGGTWIYDRANWCPGTRSQIFDHEITPYISSGDSVEINVDYQSYSWSGTQTPSYIVESQLIQYKNPNFENSAEIIDIIKPSLKDEHSRKNPICGKPLIVIKNYGSNTLTSLTIEYNIVGGSTNTFEWVGNLAFNESEEVELPNLTSWEGTENTFEVLLKKPNGLSDEYAVNNSMQSAYEPVPDYPETFSLWLLTNDGVINTSTQASESSWDFYDINGTEIHSSGTLYADEQYIDTFTFTPGCYAFVLEDSDEDGLKFWANNDGNGAVKFRKLAGQWLKNFNADFGTNIVHNFSVNFPVNIAEITEDSFDIFPNPAKNQITISVSQSNEVDVDFVIFNSLGEELDRVVRKNLTMGAETFDTSTYSPGIYYCKIVTINAEKIQKFVIIE